FGARIGCPDFPGHAQTNCGRPAISVMIAVVPIDPARRALPRFNMLTPFPEHYVIHVNRVQSHWKNDAEAVDRSLSGNARPFPCGDRKQFAANSLASRNNRRKALRDLLFALTK